MTAETPEFDRMSQGMIRHDGPQKNQLVSKKSNLEMRYDALYDAIHQLATNVESLVGELTPVLGPSYPVPSSDETESDTSEQSTVASNIQQLTRVTEMINDTVHSVRRRLEV